MRLLLLLFLSVVYATAGRSSEEDSAEKPRKWKKMKKTEWGPEMIPGFPAMPGMPGFPGLPMMPPPPKFRGKFMGEMKQKSLRVPPFLREANEENRKAIVDVMADRKLSIEEKDAKIEEILKNDSPAAQEAFAKFKSDMAARKETMEKEMAQRREKLSPAAKEADEALTKIMKDQSLSGRDRREQLKELFMSLPDEVQRELTAMRRGYRNNKVAMKIKEVGDFIGDVRMGIHDAFRSAIGLRHPMRRLPRPNRKPEPATVETPETNAVEANLVDDSPEPVRRAPMRRLPPKFPQPDFQLETKPIAVSEDGELIEF